MNVSTYRLVVDNSNCKRAVILSDNLYHWSAVPKTKPLNPEPLTLSNGIFPLNTNL